MIASIFLCRVIVSVKSVSILELVLLFSWETERDRVRDRQTDRQRQRQLREVKRQTGE